MQIGQRSAGERAAVLEKFFSSMSSLSRAQRQLVFANHLAIPLLTSNACRDTLLALPPSKWMEWMLALLLPCTSNSSSSSSGSGSGGAEEAEATYSVEAQRAFFSLVLTSVVSLAHTFFLKRDSDADGMAAITTALVTAPGAVFGGTWQDSACGVARLALNSLLNKIGHSVDVFRGDLLHPSYANLCAVLSVIEEFVFYRPLRPLDQEPSADGSSAAAAPSECGLHVDAAGSPDVVLLQNLCSVLARLRLPALVHLSHDKKEAALQKAMKVRACVRARCTAVPFGRQCDVH